MMIHTIKNEFLTVTAEEKGAQLQSIRDAEGTEYLWQGDPKYWPDRALNLFPYVARLTQGSYYLDGQLYHMDIHGIAPYSVFRQVSNDGSRMVLELRADETTRASYPREFVFRVMYSLRGKTLEITYEVENLDEKIMYFGLGGHPGFRVPLAQGKKFEDYRLRFAHPCKPQRVGFSQTCFVTGERQPFKLENGRDIPLCHKLFDDDAIVLADVDHRITLQTDGDSHGITVTFPQMDYLGLWHWPKTDAPYICIEPWCSLPAAAGKTVVMEEQKDLIALNPGKTYENRWTIQICNGD